MSPRFNPLSRTATLAAAVCLAAGALCFSAAAALSQERQTLVRVARSAADAGAVMEPAAVVADLARRGFQVTGTMVLRGPTYVGRARSPHGQAVRLVVDGRNAEIVGVRAIGP